MEVAKRPKTGGRVKGTKNKPKPYMVALDNFIENYMTEGEDGSVSQFMEDVRQLEPKDRLMIVEKYMAYRKPKMASVTSDVTLSANRSVEEELSKLST